NPLTLLFWIGTALAKILWLETHALKEKSALFVLIIIRLSDTRLAVVIFLRSRREQVAQLQTECPDNVFDGTTRVAVKQNAAVLACRDRQRGVTVVMRRAVHVPAITRFFDTLQ